MYLSSNEKYWTIDIEGDLIPSTKVYVVCAVNVKTGEEWSGRTYDKIREWFRLRCQEGCKFIGHNIIGYDAPTLNRIVGTRLSISMLIDTMVLSMLYSPSLEGGHSLDAWGLRVGMKKLPFNDFSKYTPEMHKYCLVDTRLCRRVYILLVQRMNKIGFTDDGCEIEHKAWHIIKKQKDNGFFFDLPKAHTLYATLRGVENETRDEIYKYWPPELQIVARYKQAKKKDGSYTSNFLKHRDQFVRLEELNDGGYVAWDYVSFNIGSPPQRTEKLLELGWEPREFTKTGNPKPTDKGKLVPSLVEFVEKANKPEVRLIAQWIEINSRANMVNTWIEAYNDDTKCIHGNLWFANTLRYRHSDPNSANIPAVRLYKDDNGEEHPLLERTGAYTYEARDLWGVRASDRVLVGVDAKGIQLRVLAHYLNNPEFTKAVLDGDPHSYNQEIGGFASRPIAKTFIYAFLLGAGDAKIGQIIGGTTKDGREIKARFINNFPGLGDLLDDLARQVERTGRIRLCDGTPLLVEKPHTRLGYLLQGDESRIMKKAAILVDTDVRRRRLDVLKVGDIHDEWQNDVLKTHSDEFAWDICPRAFKTTGEFFNYRLPIACDAKIGMTWAETH